MQQLAQEMVARSAATPEAVAVVDDTGAHALADVVHEAAAFATVLEQRLDGRPPTVLVQADNTWRTLAAAVGIGLRGGVVAVISGHATRSEYELALEDIRPDAVLAAPETLATWQVGDDLVHAADVLDGWPVHVAASGRTHGRERWRGGCVVAMTSGSTGRPKCVVQSEDALRYAGQATIDAVGLEPGDPVAALVPLSSVAAFCFGMHLPAMLGSPMVCLAKWQPDEAVRLLDEQQVAWTMLVPTMALQLSLVDGSEGRLSSLKALTVGGGPMDAGALGRAEDHLGTKFLRVFGMSEALGHTTPLPTEDAAVRLGRDGRPFPGTEQRVVDDAGAPVARGGVGHLQVRGPSLFVGYARNGVAEQPEVTSDGFLRTGDRARINDDGTLNILGREKQVIIRGGRNIDINEVESAVAAIPGIAQVCVVPVPDPLLGERAAALVVVSAGTLDLDDVRRHLARADVPKFKWPEFVHVVSDLPQNRVGKLNRSQATELAQALSRSETA